MGNAENRVGNTRNEMEMQIRGIRMGMHTIWVEMRQMWEIRMAMQGIKEGT